VVENNANELLILCYILEISREQKRQFPELSKAPGRPIQKRKRTCNPGAVSALGSEVTDDTGIPIQLFDSKLFGIEWRHELPPDLNH